jgi:hypothetical protein
LLAATSVTLYILPWNFGSKPVIPSVVFIFS